MSDESKYRKYAEKVKIFHGLSPEEVEFILHCGNVLHFHENQTIFHEGMLGTNVFIVLSGEVGIYNKSELIAKCEVGDAFGEMAVLNRRPRIASATAITPAKVFTLDERSINNILEKHVAVRLLLNVIHILSERLEKANAENVELRKALRRTGGAPARQQTH
ncbi:MAG TPA: cyclic nucleotide-binding domain-containing protein [Candidatus Hydrogenedentes bacterium]|nr:cyclic nucleotide-binding domain-containing protein [Candidatus Hydrogenedentota bacterium]HNT88894.1 cyclic nucleotide-binding domain-containing protein [Candidatus Hydrogenedentota bacterium]